MSSIPAALTGSTWSPKKATISAIAPKVPGKIRPGLKSSTVIPSTPSERSSTMMFGSMRVSRILFQSDMWIVVTSAPAVWSDEALRLRLHPVDVVQEGGQVGRDHVDDVLVERLLGGQVGGLTRTASSAQSAFRPCVSARPRM